MKRLFIILFAVFTTLSSAQEVRTQKEILDIPNTDLVSDFNLKVGNGNVVPLTVSKATYKDIGFSFVGHKFKYMKGDYSLEILTFKNKKLVQSTTDYNYGTFMKPQGFKFQYTYDSNGNLSKRTSTSTSSTETNETFYTYSNNKIKQVRETGTFSDGKKYDKTRKFVYKGTTISYDFENGNKSFELQNKLITQEKTFNKSANKNYINTYKYNSNGFITAQDRGAYQATYTLNDKSQIAKEVNKTYTQTFKYVYDKYGNWVIAYPLSTSNKNLYGSQFSYYIREIKYSNGDVTGSVNPDDNTTKTTIIKLRSELYDKLILGKKSYVAKKIRNVDLGFPLMEIEEDYGLRIGNQDIVPVKLNKKQYDQRKSRGSNKFTTELKMESVTDFDLKLKKVKVSKVIRKGATTTYNFNYNAQGKLKKYWSEGSRYGNHYENYSYQGNGDFIRATSFKTDGASVKDIYKKTADGYVISGQSSQKIFAENNLIKKKVIGYDTNEPSESFYTHNNDGKMIKLESSFSTIINRYNTKGDVQFFKETSKRNGNYTIRNYAYKYDRFGNWIIQVHLLDMSIAKGIPSYPQPTLRQITYSNGEVTGTTDITKVENDLVALRKKVRTMDTDTNVGSQIATWKKAKEDNFYIYINNKPVQKAQLSYMGGHILAFIQDNNQLYLLENVKNAKINTTYNTKKIDIETTHGYWFKKSDGSVVVFKNNGVVMQKSSLYKYAPNNIDVFYQGENEPEKVVLKDYKTVKTYTPYTVILHRDYKNGSSENMTDNAKKLAKSLDEYAEYYRGECIKGDCENGYGEQKFKDGNVAGGFFKGGKPYGPAHTSNEKTKGSFFSVYKGSYQNREGFVYEFNGDNLMIFYDMSKNIGFYNDYKTKKTYVLNYKNGKVISKRELQYNNSTTCVVGNCNNGVGIYEYGNSTYMGTFKNGKREGFGYLFFKSGGSYIGEFYNNNYHGLGTYTISDYDYYMGFYQNGKPHGQGVQFKSKDNYSAGNWVNGQLQRTTTSNKISTTSNSNSTTNTTANTSFSEAQKNKILACKNDSECVSRYLTSLYVEERKTLSGDALIRKTTDYFHSVYIMNPKLAYDTLFKMDISLIDLKMLPQAVQADLRARAQKLSDAYQKHQKKQGY